LSLRLPSAEKGPPASVGWFFPPGVGGCLRLSDLVLGYDPTSPAYEPVQGLLETYMEQVSALGGTPKTNGGLVARHLPPGIISARIDRVQALDTLSAHQGD